MCKTHLAGGSCASRVAAFTTLAVAACAIQDRATADVFEPTPVVLWGPTAFVWGPGQPVGQTAEIDLGMAEAPFQLRVVNGLSDGTRRCSSALISVNGATVLGPSAFSQRVDSVEGPTARSRPRAVPTTPRKRGSCSLRAQWSAWGTCGNRSK